MNRDSVGAPGGTGNFQKLRFDILHLIELDLLLLDNILQRFRRVRDSVAVSNLAPLRSEADPRIRWRPCAAAGSCNCSLTTSASFRAYGPNPMKYMFGTTFSRAFLDRYAATGCPPACATTRYAYPVAQAFGMPVVDGACRGRSTATDAQFVGASGVSLGFLHRCISAFHLVGIRWMRPRYGALRGPRRCASELGR